MRAKLIHNPSAGDAQHSADELVRTLERLGFEVQKAKGVRESRIGCDEPEERVDLVVAAGGDGTIARALRDLAGSTTPLAVVPLGTANNVARSLGLYDEDAARALQHLAHPVRRRIDLGVASGSWGELPFVEAAGVGLFQHVLQHEASDEDKTPKRARQLLLNKLAEGHASRLLRFEIDDKEYEEELLLFEVLSIRSTGPRLHLAPEADPFDGLFDVVRIHHDDRRRLERYLQALIEGDEEATPDLDVVRATHVRLQLGESSVRVDDRVLPDAHPPSPECDLRVMPAAVEMWLPG